VEKNFSVYIKTRGGAAPKLTSIKFLIDLMVKMGFNRFYLGCSDMFEIENEPYFGYMRGRYSDRKSEPIRFDK